MYMMLEQFKNIFDRPEKVKKLREIILDLAVRGKLVPQDPNDEPASILLERIKEEKEKLIKEKKIKKEKPLEEISEDEKPFELPDGWEWVRLKEIGYSLGQKKPDKLFTYIDVGSINKEKGEIGEELTIINPEDAPSRARKLVDRGTVIYSTVRPYLLNIAIVDKKFEFEPIVSTAFAVIHPCNGVNNKFILYYLRSIPFVRYVESQMVGMAYPAINDEKLFSGVFPVPPSEEQKRIVEKVDLLMTFCDKLEKALEKKVHYGELSAKSVFSAVANVSTFEELKETLKFILLNFKDISLGDNAVKELKNCILQLAVQGKLVPQDSNDEAAEVFLEKIRKEKARLIKERKIKKEKPLTEINEEEKHFELPELWSFIKLGDITTIKGGKRVPAGYRLLDNKTEHIYIRVSDMKNGSICENKLKYISEEVFEKIKEYTIEKDDLYITIVGSTIGKAGIVPAKFHKMNLTENAARIIIHLVDKTYLLYFINSLYVQEQLLDKTNQVGQPKLALTRLKDTIIPLAPYNEQKRIVKKVNSLIALCDKLEKKIEKQKEYSSRLMESIIRYDK